MIRIAEPLPSDDGPYEYRGRFAADAMLEFTGDFDADVRCICISTLVRPNCWPLADR